VDDNHPSIQAIRENCNFEDNLSFTEISDDFVEKQINKINVNKFTGFDGVSVKIMKMAKPVIVKPITKLINKSISSAKFPDNLKEAHVVPLHKKNSQLEARNYRPVSILPVVSKFFERAIYQQLIDYFDSIFNPYLSAFRPGYGCNTALLKVIEDWKKAVNNNLYVAAVLMDLSKAFDCLPHDLLLLKLKVYSLSENALNLTDDYLSNRKQCVKVGTYFSTWQHIYKGVPQ
jgi:retron-type reverse transcriptase